MANIHNQKILLTGGSGVLGREILKLDSSLIAPSHAELDITKPETIVAVFDRYNPDIVIHLAAATKPSEHEKNPGLGIDVNIGGTVNIAHACFERGIRLVYTSSDYVYSGAGPHQEGEPVSAPSNFILSKLGGECAVRLVPNSLILRLSFGPVPFPWEKVYQGQWNSKLYADEISPLVFHAACSRARGIMNLGGPRTSLEDYARRTRPDIETIPKPDWVPEDTSLHLARMKEELGIEDETTLIKHKARAV